MTAHTFTVGMIKICSISCIGCTLAYICLARGYFAVFFWKVGFVLSHVFGGFADLFCQAWLDLSKPFRKKAVKLDDHEKKISS